MNNLEKYKKDLESLISEGKILSIMMGYKCQPEQFKDSSKQVKKARSKLNSYEKTISTVNNRVKEAVKKHPKFTKALIASAGTKTLRLKTPLWKYKQGFEH